MHGYKRGGKVRSEDERGVEEERTAVEAVLCQGREREETS